MDAQLKKVVNNMAQTKPQRRSETGLMDRSEDGTIMLKS